VIRRGFGYALAMTGTLCGLLLWLALDGAGAAERSSPEALAPKHPPAALQAAAPEGGPVAATLAGAAEPIQLAQSEAAAAPAPAAEETRTAARPAPRAGILEVDSDQPLSIQADELEAVEEADGRRRLVFNRRVKLDQGDLVVQSDRLEAHYAPQASEPERLVAVGNVRVRQEARELSCARATYFPGRERLECTGNALLRDGANRVSGETIEILFGEDRILVKGGAVVNVVPDKKEKRAAPKASAEARAREETP